MSSTFFNNLVAATYLTTRSMGEDLDFGFLFDGLDAVAASVAEKVASIWNSIFSDWKMKEGTIFTADVFEEGKETTYKVMKERKVKFETNDGETIFRLFQLKPVNNDQQ